MAEAEKLPSSLDGWLELFNVLLPPERLTLTDVTGGKHEVVPILPGLMELELVQILSKIGDLAGGEELKQKFLAIQRETKGLGQIGVMLSMARVLIRDRAEVLDIVGEAFALAYPEAVEAAVANVREKRPRLLAKVQGEPGAQHVFELGELIGGLLPFGARIAATIREKIMSLQAPRT